MGFRGVRIRTIGHECTQTCFDKKVPFPKNLCAILLVHLESYVTFAAFWNGNSLLTRNICHIFHYEIIHIYTQQNKSVPLCSKLSKKCSCRFQVPESCLWKILMTQTLHQQKELHKSIVLKLHTMRRPAFVVRPILSQVHSFQFLTPGSSGSSCTLLRSTSSSSSTF